MANGYHYPENGPTVGSMHYNARTNCHSEPLAKNLAS